ncbi:MAG: right-handed parallel beta-helix repeat-containing protein [Ginsengibacter sp.]
MKSFYFALLFSVFYLFPFTAPATTYYLSPDGDNINSGTSVTAPWKTITNININTFIGDTILFLAGSTFTGNIGFGSSDIGTPARPIVIGSYGNGRATISSGNSYGISIYNAGGFIIKDLIFMGSGRTVNTQAGILVYMDKDSTRLSYIRIDNVEVYGYRNAGISVGSWNKAGGLDDVSIINSISHDNGKAGIASFAKFNYVNKNVYIAYNKVYDNPGIATDTTSNSGSGIVINGANGAVIEYCTSYNNGWLHSNANGGPVGIWAFGCNNIIMQFNESHHNKTNNSKDGGGFDLDAGSTNSIMQYNYSHDNTGPGFMAAQRSGAPLMQKNIIRYNISENDVRKNSYGAIHLWTQSSTAIIQGLEIYNNTVYLIPGTNTSCKAFYYQSGNVSAVNVRNNIFQTTKTSQLVNLNKLTGLTFQGNNYWPTGSTFKIVVGTKTYSSLTQWRDSTGQEKVNGSSKGFQVDPKFLDTIRGVTFNDATQLSNLKTYKLKTTSGLINKGLNLKKLFVLNIGTRDFWGSNITADSLFNIGAYDLNPITLRRDINSDNEATQSELNQISLDAFPNPFSVNAKVGFALPKAAKVNIVLYNFEGKMVRSLFIGNVLAGEYKSLTLNAEGLSSGPYIVRVVSEEKVLFQKIIVRQ